MRISDWSSDVCSSDLLGALLGADALATLDAEVAAEAEDPRADQETDADAGGHDREADVADLLGHAAGREEDRQSDDQQQTSTRGSQHQAPGAVDSRGAGPHQREAEGREAGGPDRSEEHTSELQSLMRISYAVFCLK